MQSKEEQHNISELGDLDSAKLIKDGIDLTQTITIKKDPEGLLRRIDNVPDKVDQYHLLKNLDYFLLHHGLTEKITHIYYLGGCSNHALRVTLDTKEHGLKNVLVRIPGSSSDLLVDREAERINTALVAELGICPPFAEQFAAAGNLLQAEGYKVETFLEDAKPLTHESFNQYRTMALAQLKKVHQCGKEFATEYNLLERLKLMCYSVQDLVGEQVFVNLQREGHQSTSIAAIIKQIEHLERLAKAFGKIKLLPCHNDIPPFNFMLVANDSEPEAIKIIDWEYGGMNDPMCELAYIANENGYHSLSAISDLISDYYADEHLGEAELQINRARVLFYLPLIDLKVALWSLMQVHMCNQSQYIDELRAGWGPERYERYLEKINTDEYKELLITLERKLNQSVSHYSLFRVRDNEDSSSSSSQFGYTF